MIDERGDTRLKDVAVTVVAQAEELFDGRLVIRHVYRRMKYAIR